MPVWSENTDEQSSNKEKVSSQQGAIAACIRRKVARNASIEQTLNSQQCLRPFKQQKRCRKARLKRFSIYGSNKRIKLPPMALQCALRLSSRQKKHARLSSLRWNQHLKNHIICHPDIEPLLPVFSSTSHRLPNTDSTQRHYHIPDSHTFPLSAPFSYA